LSLEIIKLSKSKTWRKTKKRDSLLQEIRFLQEQIKKERREKELIREKMNYLLNREIRRASKHRKNLKRRKARR